MTFVGCDLHTRTQQVAVLDTRTGEVSEHQLVHDGRAGEGFYAALPRPVTVGIESTGYAVWFHALMQLDDQGVHLSEPPFIGNVPLQFGIADAAAHYHVPLLCSPWAYSTYRGS